jgi:hypothetical protein
MPGIERRMNAHRQPSAAAMPPASSADSADSGVARRCTRNMRGWFSGEYSESTSRCASGTS